MFKYSNIQKFNTHVERVRNTTTTATMKIFLVESVLNIYFSMWMWNMMTLLEYVHHILAVCDCAPHHENHFIKHPWSNKCVLLY